MKKFWKNLCVCSMAVVSACSLWACGKQATEVSIDLDGDGAISAWETIFEAKQYSSRDLLNISNVVDIGNLADLKSINSKVNETHVYRLVRDIDCNGETISINLGSSTLLGNNRVIKNFKLGDCVYPISEDKNFEGNIKGLFYNGVCIIKHNFLITNK